MPRREGIRDRAQTGTRTANPLGSQPPRYDQSPVPHERGLAATRRPRGRRDDRTTTPADRRQRPEHVWRGARTPRSPHRRRVHPAPARHSVHDEGAGAGKGRRCSGQRGVRRDPGAAGERGTVMAPGVSARLQPARSRPAKSDRRLARRLGSLRPALPREACARRSLPATGHRSRDLPASPVGDRRLPVEQGWTRRHLLRDEQRGAGQRRGFAPAAVGRPRRSATRSAAPLGARSVACECHWQPRVPALSGAGRCRRRAPPSRRTPTRRGAARGPSEHQPRRRAAQRLAVDRGACDGHGRYPGANDAGRPRDGILRLHALQEESRTRTRREGRSDSRVRRARTTWRTATCTGTG